VSLSDAAKGQLNTVSTATLTSQLLKRGFRNTFVTGCVPLCPQLRLLGYAFTLRYAPAREDLDVDVDFDNDTNVQRLRSRRSGRRRCSSSTPAASSAQRRSATS
jgi:hypothetical protein